MELKETTAVITGASGRLGSDIAQALARAGCNCICHYHTNQTKALTVVEQIRQSGVEALAVQADLTRPEEAARLFDQAEQLGKPRVLVNSAAVFARAELEQVSLEQLREVLDLNLCAAILTSRSFARGLGAEARQARLPIAKIVNISDVGGIRPWAGYTAYCSSKAALIGATKALAKELAPAICVNCVAPGIIGEGQNMEERERQRQLSFIPAGRFGRIRELIEAVVFLLKHDYITGQVLNVDGGRCI